MSWRSALVAATFAVSALVHHGTAQSTGTPVFEAPYRAFAKGEIGASLSEPGAGFDLEGSFRGGISTNVDAGLRGGFYSVSGQPATALFGGDIRVRVITHNASFPLDASATGGVGVQSISHSTVGLIPIGFSMGRRLLLEGSEVSLVPYIQPVATLLFGDKTGAHFSLGFGLDARVTPRIDLRFSAAVGNLSGIGFTVAFLH